MPFNFSLLFAILFNFFFLYVFLFLGYTKANFFYFLGAIPFAYSLIDVLFLKCPNCKSRQFQLIHRSDDINKKLSKEEIQASKEGISNYTETSKNEYIKKFYRCKKCFHIWW